MLKILCQRGGWKGVRDGTQKVKGVKFPVLIIKGDNDSVELSQVAEMYQLVGGGCLRT
jgi:hypothetical protein